MSDVVDAVVVVVVLCLYMVLPLCLQEFLQNYKTVQLISKEAFDELHSNVPPPVPANQKVPPPPPLPVTTTPGRFLRAVQTFVIMAHYRKLISINQSISLIATLRPESRIANDMQLK